MCVHCKIPDVIFYCLQNKFQLKDLIARCISIPMYKFLVMCCLSRLVSKVKEEKVKVTVMNGLLSLVMTILQTSDKVRAKVECCSFFI